MPVIHPTAIVDPGAVVDATVEIGPYCIVGEKVALEKGVRLHSHVVIAGKTKIGAGTEIFPFASIGHRPQDLKYAGEESSLEVGRNNSIREYVTMNPGTEGGGMVTRVGDDGLFMAGAHVAHDCQVGDSVILANNATLAGHVTLGNHAIVGGLSAVHQFVRIGDHAMIGGMTGVEHDVIPFGMALGERARLSGLNLVGLRRRDIDRDEIAALRSAYTDVFESEGTLAERAQTVMKRYEDSALVQELARFIVSESQRALCLPHRVEK